MYTTIASGVMLDGVDLDVAQARVNLLPDKCDRRRISQALTIRRLSGRYYKRPMSEGNVCSGWMLLLFLVWSVHHILSKYWWSFKRRHWVLICFVSLPMALCWIFVFKSLNTVCGALVRCHTVFCGRWQFLKWCCLAVEVHGQLDNNHARQNGNAMGSKVTNDPHHHISYEMYQYFGLVWGWFGSLSLRLPQLVIRQCLMMSGDVELNPGPSEIIITVTVSEKTRHIAHSMKF